MKIETRKQGASICLFVEFGPVLGSEHVREMAEEVERAIEGADDLRLLLDLSRTTRIEPSAFLSPAGLATSLKSIGPVSRYAVIGAPALAETAIEGFGTLLPLKSRTFEAGAAGEARAWVLGAEH
jgi:anti-anti-sigma regulatory factor